jgi:L-aspartate oxidase
MGGVLTGASGRASIDGLWACGEVASTGAHGANRLASNSLLEAVVFAARVADDIRDQLPAAQTLPATALPSDGGADPDPADVRQLRHAMTDQVGVVRTGEGLEAALAVIDALAKRSRSPRFDNTLAAARLIAAAALLRTESRGGHYRADFPAADPALRHRTFITLADAERVSRAMPAPVSAD